MPSASSDVRPGVARVLPPLAAGELDDDGAEAGERPRARRPPAPSARLRLAPSRRASDGRGRRAHDHRPIDGEVEPDADVPADAGSASTRGRHAGRSAAPRSCRPARRATRRGCARRWRNVGFKPMARRSVCAWRRRAGGRHRPRIIRRCTRTPCSNIATELLHRVLQLEQPADGVVSDFFRAAPRARQPRAPHAGRDHLRGAAPAPAVTSTWRSRARASSSAAWRSWPGRATTASCAPRSSEAEQQWLAQARAVDRATLPEQLRHNLPDWLADGCRRPLGDEFWPLVDSARTSGAARPARQRAARPSARRCRRRWRRPASRRSPTPYSPLGPAHRRQAGAAQARRLHCAATSRCRTRAASCWRC